MAYKNWATNDVPSAADFNNMFGDAQTADTTAGETTSSTSYTDLATPGPAVTINLVAGQQCLVFVSARVSNSIGGSGFSSLHSFAVSAPSSTAASDVNGCEAIDDKTLTLTRVTLFTAGGTGAHTFTMKYRVIGA